MIKIEHNADEIELALQEFKTVALPKARRRALFSTGGEIIETMKDYIYSEGEGDWPEVHPLTRLWKPRGNRFVRRGDYRGPYRRVAANIRYKVTDRGDEAQVESIIARPGNRPSPSILFAFERMHEGKTTPIKDSMRKRFGATRRGKNAEPGKDFFPLSKNRKELKIDKRPVVEPVFSANKTRYKNVFSKKLIDTLMKESKL